MSKSGATPSLNRLDRLAQALQHRGPDDVGRHIRDGVGVVARRLSIIDLETGHQPLVGPDGCALVVNGEVYNYLELRRQAFPDATFVTAADSEAILKLYERRGVDGFEALRGMYAIALHDPRTRSLVLARDPFGIKPLYYVEAAEHFAFASEPQALIAAGLVSPEIALEPVRELLQLGFTTGAKTAFRQVRRLLPGEVIVVRDGEIRERRVRSALPGGGPMQLTEPEALLRLDEALLDSVEVHLRSDTPLGLFLSGGVDSRTILACMARLGAARVRAYTAAFPGAARVADESESASRAAALFGAEHVRVEVTARDFWSALPAVVAHIDDPVADATVVPTWLLAREAAKDVRVVLCGEGGDEIFAGYSRYRRQSLPWWLGGRARRRRGPFSGAGVLREEPAGWRDGIVAAERASSGGGRSRLQVAQAVDCVDFLAHNLLTKVDRSLMAHGVEGRTPLLDRAVAEVGFRLPEELKLRQSRGKYLLRRWLSEQAPQDDCFSRKTGFTPPYLEWLRADGARLGPLVAADTAIRALCRPGTVEPLFVSRDKQALEAAWRLLFYALWHRRHARGLCAEGGVLDRLSAKG
jgi:asparagine synthase (glutamine-hydrolysing)